MNSYTFRQHCRPIGDFRTNEIVNFFSLMKEAFNITDIYDSNNKKIELSRNFLLEIFKKELEKEIFPKTGIDIDFFTIPPSKRDNNTRRFEIHTGTHVDERFIDFYNISMSNAKKVPDFYYLRKSIEIFKPNEAFLSENNNEFDLVSDKRLKYAKKHNQPAIIRGFHYIDEERAKSIGGIERCLETPAWKIERFCEGVLIQLTEGLFDTSNKQHLKIQKKAMKYLKIW